MQTSPTYSSRRRRTPRFLSRTPALIGLVALSLATGAASATDLVYELAVRSPHVWRGITLRQFSVFNASITADFSNGWAFQLWLGLDLEDGDGRRGEVQEIDLDLSYTWDLESSRITTGVIELIFPGGIDPTGELYFKWQSKRFLQPQVDVYYNFDLLRDAFVQLKLGHQWRKSKLLSPSLSGTVAYSGAQYARFFAGSKAGLHHWGLQLDLDYRMRQTAIKLRLGYSKSIDPKVLPDQPDRFWTGIYWSLRRPFSSKQAVGNR